MSNSRKVLDRIDTLHRAHPDLDPTQSLALTKALGMWWDPESDSFVFSRLPTLNPVETIRQLLQSIAKVHDPIGVLCRHFAYLCKMFWRSI